MDYAVKKGVSLSTLRRHIKANKVQYKVENGRYLIFYDENASGAATPSPSSAPANFSVESGSAVLQSKLTKLERDLRHAQEEISELKMLIALYEEKMSPQKLDS